MSSREPQELYAIIFLACAQSMVGNRPEKTGDAWISLREKFSRKTGRFITKSYSWGKQSGGRKGVHLVMASLGKWVWGTFSHLLMRCEFVARFWKPNCFIALFIHVQLIASQAEWAVGCMNDTLTTGLTCTCCCSPFEGWEGKTEAGWGQSWELSAVTVWNQAESVCSVTCLPCVNPCCTRGSRNICGRQELESPYFYL